MAFLRCPQCAVKCGTHYVPYDVLRSLKMGFRRLENNKSESLLKKYLTEELLEQLKFRKTSNNVNLYNCIKVGLTHEDSKIGVYACDPECYFVFWPIFFPILQELHGFSPSDLHPKSQWGPVKSISNLDHHKEIIKLTRIRVNRNLKGYPFCCQMTENDFENMEEFLSMILALMTGEYDGKYEKISEMSVERERELREKFILFDNKNKYLDAACSYRDWPVGRGVFINSQENFIVQVNPNDHMKVISVERGGNIRRTYERLTKAVLKLQQDLNFVKSERMGFVTSCPSDMGTGLKISVHLMLPRLWNNMGKIEEVANKYGVGVRIVTDRMEVLEIFNKKRLGITEIGSVLSVERAVLDLIRLEHDS